MDEQKPAKVYTRAEAKFYLVICTIVITFGSSIGLGWVSMTQILIREGNFEEECDDDHDFDEDGACLEQKAKLSLIFSIASMTLAVGFTITGLLLDKFGPRFTCLLGVVMVSIGLLIFGLAPKSNFTMLLIGEVLLTTFGACPYIPALNFANLFDNNRTVLGYLAGLFNFPIIIYAIFNTIHENSEVTKKQLCLFYLIVLFICFCLGWIYPMTPFTPNQRAWFHSSPMKGDCQKMEDNGNFEALPSADKESPEKEAELCDLKKAPEDEVGGIDVQLDRMESQEGLNTNDDANKASKPALAAKRVSTAFLGTYDPKTTTLKQKLMSRPFFFVYLLFGGIQVAKLNFWWAILNATLLSYGESEDGIILKMISYMLSMGVFFSPLMGRVNDIKGIQFGAKLNTTLNILLFVLTAVPVYQFQLLSTLAYVIVRPHIFSVIISFAFKFTGGPGFGTIHGLGSAYISVILVSQYFLNYMTYDLLSGNFVLTHLILAALSIPSYYVDRILKETEII